MNRFHLRMMMEKKKKGVRQMNLQNAAHIKKPHKHAEPITERW